jgi:hypothetical protein
MRGSPSSKLDRDRLKIIKDEPLELAEVVARGGVEPPTFRFSDLGKSVQEHSLNLSVLIHEL